ncbi:MAG: response regulator transcription factor [Treponema sp.]|nr:response regulator transcription factor [Treponema sp.]
MTTIICAAAAFAGLALVFAVQNFLLLTSSSLVYLYEALSALELYASLCLLYFSIRIYEQKTRKHFRFLFAKVFWPALFYSLAIIFNLDFNALTLATSLASFVLIAASAFAIILSLLYKQPASCDAAAESVLSKREREVTALLLQGKTSQETADALFVSLATIKTHVQRIYQKTGARNRAQLALFMQNHPFG